MSGRDTSEVAAAAIVGIGATVAVTGLTIGLSALWAFVIHQLWGWFAVPLGAPVLSIAHVWGLAILKGMVFYKQPADDYKPNWSMMLTYPLIAWGLGALAAWWMV